MSFKIKPALIVASITLIITSSLSAQRLHQEIDKLFSKDDVNRGAGIHLPSLLTTKKGTVIAVCQMRKDSPHDFGDDVDLYLKRSLDEGKTWLPIQIVYSKKGINAVNGPIVQDKKTGAIIIPFCAVPTSAKSQRDWVNYQVSSGGNLFSIISHDEGETWSAVQKTKPISKDNLVAWPSNSAHGIQLQSGRLVIGGFIANKKPNDQTHQSAEYSSGLLYSDDSGKTWHIGAKIPYNGTDEIILEATQQGEIYVNYRFNNRRPADLVRGYARSRDKGESFYEIGLQDNMSIVNCHSGLVRYARKDSQGRSIMLYSGPTGSAMENGFIARSGLTLRASFDEGETWPISKVIARGSASYSDLAIASNGDILCVFGVNTFDASKSKLNLIRVSWDELENN